MRHGSSHSTAAPLLHPGLPWFYLGAPPCLRACFQVKCFCSGRHAWERCSRIAGALPSMSVAVPRPTTQHVHFRDSLSSWCLLPVHSESHPLPRASAPVAGTDRGSLNTCGVGTLQEPQPLTHSSSRRVAGHIFFKLCRTGHRCHRLHARRLPAPRCRCPCPLSQCCLRCDVRTMPPRRRLKEAGRRRSQRLKAPSEGKAGG